MKNVKKLLVLLLTLTIALSLFAGCNGGGSSSSSAASQASSTDAGSEDSAAPAGLDTSKEVELVMYVISDRPAKQDEIDANYNAILKEKLNATIKLNWIGWAEYANKYPLLFSSGEKFDMAYTATWLNYAQLAQRGAFKDITELWPTYAPLNYARQSETAKQQATINGKYYCVPTLLATYSAYGPIYRTDIMEGTDWDGKMENLADLETYLSIVKESTTMEPYNVYQQGSEVDDVFMFEHGLYAIKGSTNDFLWFDPQEANPTLFTYYEYENTPEFLEMMNRWNENGYFPKSALSDTDSTKVRNGKAATRMHNVDAYQGEAIDNPDWGFKYANFVTDVSNMSFTQDALAIANTSENPERALAFYDFLTSDETFYRAFTYGIEGVSYEIIDGQVKQPSNPDEYAFSALWAARTPGLHLATVGTPADIATMKADWDSHIVDGQGSQKFRSLTIDTNSVETEYAACLNVHQQYWWPLELGYTDPVAGLEEYKAKMEAAGIDKVREALQKQLDDYLASLG
ncbi:MAG: ABC transporter substrate-binding protein [Oscillospiraceae bacterium]